MSHKVFEKHFEQGSFITFDERPLGLEFSEVNQIHSAQIVPCTDNEVKADGIYWSDDLGVSQRSLAIKTADCLPILVLGKLGYAMIHAGWRGLEQKILTEKSLAKLDPYYFLIGPHISQDNYEVDKQFKNNFPDSSHFHQHKKKITFNLASEARDQIFHSFANCSVEESNLCTYEDPRLNSYRKDKTEKRNYNLFIPRV